MKTYFKNHKALSCFTPPYYTFICWVFEHSKVLAELAVCRMNNRPIRPNEIFSYLYNFRTCERYVSQRRDFDICAITSRKGTSMLCVYAYKIAGIVGGRTSHISTLLHHVCAGTCPMTGISHDTIPFPLE